MALFQRGYRSGLLVEDVSSSKERSGYLNSHALVVHSEDQDSLQGPPANYQLQSLALLLNRSHFFNLANPIFICNMHIIITTVLPLLASYISCSAAAVYSQRNTDTSIHARNIAYRGLPGRELRIRAEPEVALNRKIAEPGRYPAIDIVRSGSRKEESVLSEEHRKKAEAARKVLESKKHSK